MNIAELVSEPCNKVVKAIEKDVMGAMPNKGLSCAPHPLPTHTHNATQRDATHTQCNATQRNATHRKATQRNATDRNATQRNAQAQ